jgi:hypothetical protein
VKEEGAMSRNQAAVMAAKLRKEGKEYGEIGEILAKQGVVSSRTGKTLTEGGVCALISRRRRSRVRGARRGSTSTTTTMAKTQLLKSIVRLATDAETKVALIDLVADL